MNNYAYIDVFCSYLFSQLVIDKKIPSFAIFYGSLNGIGDYKYDISEEYDDLRIDKCFNYTLGKGFDINMYISDSEEETESELESGSECESDFASGPELESESDSESAPESDPESESESDSESGLSLERSCRPSAGMSAPRQVSQRKTELSRS